MGVPSLADICLQTVASNNLWRVRRYTVQLLPEKYANALLHEVITHRTFTPSNLDLFRQCATVLTLHRVPDDDWIAHISGLSHLHTLEFRQEWPLQERHLPHLHHLAPTLTRLHLGGAKLTRATLPLLSALTALEHLNLQGSLNARRAPPLGTTLTPLTRLTYLSLAEAPNATDACLAATLPSLRILAHLNLATTATTHRLFPHLLPLTALTHLNLAWTLVEELPLLPQLHTLVLQSCRNLGHLPITCTAPEEPLFMSGWQLQQLDLAAARLSTINAQCLVHLISATSNTLQHLSLEASGRWPLDIPLLSTPATALRSLRLPCLPPIVEPPLLPLLCPNLTLLSLDSDPATSPAMPAITAPLLPLLQHLQHLQLPGPIEDREVACLMRLTSLTRLNLVRCLGTAVPRTHYIAGPLPPDMPPPPPTIRAPIDDEMWDLACARWRGVLPPTYLLEDTAPGARYLLVGDPTEGEVAVGWGALTRLRHLELQGHNLGAELCGRLAAARLPLTCLRLEAAMLDDRGLAFLGRLQGLRELRLTAPRLTDYGMPHLHKHAALTSLHLTCDFITRDAMMATVEALPQLQQLVGTHNWCRPTTKAAAAEPAMPLEDEVELMRLYSESIQYARPDLLHLQARSPPVRSPQSRALWQQLPADLRKPDAATRWQSGSA